MDSYGGNPLPEHVLESIERNGVALKGPITTPVGGGFRSVNVTLRKTLDLFGQVRPVQELPRRPLALRGRRPDHRPRGDRGPVCGHRVRGRLGRRARAGRVGRRARREDPRGLRHLDQADLRLRHAPHLRVRLRLRAQERPPQDHGRPQGEHHEVLGRALAARRARGRGGAPRHRVRRPHRRQPLHAARPAARGVRHARAAEPVRRHRLRPVRGPRRRPRRSRPARTSGRRRPSSSRHTARRRSTRA